ncbi:MAG: LamG-like jellyroll fold domain-containing protein [Caldilineaceae bacterium]
MKPNKLPTHPKFTLFLLLLLLAGASAVLFFLVPTAYASPADPVSAAWEKARNAGSYHFTSDVTQLTVPVAKVTNIGRSSHSEQLHLEGQNDLRQQRLEMKLWSDGGSVLQTDGGVAVKVENGKTFARRGTEEWQEADGMADGLAPQGDFLSYLQAMRNVEAHTPESRAGIQLTRYSFTIDGPTFAAYVRDQMQAAMHAKGELPLNVNLDLPQYYRDMTGNGELWIGENGLPLRQILNLDFPEQNEQTVHSQIVVDFSHFGTAQLTPSQLLRSGDWRGLLGSLSASLPNLSPLALLFPLLAGMVLLLRYRRLRTVYTGLVTALIASMVMGPLLTTLQISTFLTAQSAKAAAQDEQQRSNQAAQKMVDLGRPEFNPQVNPLEAANQNNEEIGRLGDWNSAPQSPNLSISASPALQSVDPGTDTDGDGLTDFAEVRIGTDETYKDSDEDGVPDGLEVRGFALGGKTWYVNALNLDSNNDGLNDGQEWGYNTDGTLRTTPLDTDSDKVPDLFDPDNDNDGVPDRLDLAPLTAVVATYGENNPLQLTIKNLAANTPTLVDFQIRPSNPDHLWYAFNVIDWPRNDAQGQVQDIDGGTYADLAASEGRSTGANEDFGDMKLVPMLEIRINGAVTNLPAQSGLTPYNITVNNLAADGSQKVVYVPLNVITDERTGQRMAFNARMNYLPSGSWPSPHNVRLVWATQMLSDLPCDHTNAQDVAAGCASDNYIHNVPQVVQSYYDSFTLTGLNVSEQRGAKTALIYEDPTVDGNRKDDVALTALTQGLDQSFISARDADNNGVRDVDINEIARRFNHTTNSGVTGDQRWGLDSALNILNVEQHSYPTFDQASIFTAMTDTVSILNSRFNSYWASDNSLKPTIAFAYETQSRSLGLDAAWVGSNYVSLSGTTVTVDMLPASINTMAGFKWTHYCRSGSAWDICASDNFWSELENRYGTTPLAEDGSDPDSALGSLFLLQLHNLALSEGVNRMVQVGNALISGQYALDGDSIIATRIRTGTIVGTQAVKYIANKMVMARYTNPVPVKQQLGAQFRNLTNSRVGRAVLAVKNIRTNRLTGGAVVLGVSIIIAGASIGLTYFAQELASGNQDAKIALRATIVGLQMMVSVVKPLWTIYQLSNAGSASSVLASGSEALGVTKTANAVGAVLAISVVWGFFIYSMVSNKVTPFSPEFNKALAETIAATIYIILLTILSATVVGLLIVGIVSVIDAILTAVCELGVDDLRTVPGQDGACFTLGTSATKAIAYLIYNYDLMINTKRTDLVAPGAPKTQLLDPAKGFVAGNALTVTLPITTHVVHKNPDASSGLYINQHLNLFSPDNLRSSTFRYSLTQPNPETLSGIDRNQMNSSWQNVGEDHKYGLTPMYGGYNSVTPNPVGGMKPLSGINQPAEFYLNMGYAVPAYECWGIPLLSFIVGSVCYDREFEGNTSTKIDTLRYDIFPNTLDGLMAKGAKPTGGFGPAWDATFPAMHDFDGDGLISTVYGGVDPNDAAWDTDGDGLSDSYELERRAVGLPYSLTQSDTDNDGLSDAQEAQYGSNPGIADTDNDGLKDGDEVAGWDITINSTPSLTLRVSSDPSLADTDGDGISDLAEKQLAQKSDLAQRLDDQNVPYNPNVVNRPPVTILTTTSKSIILPGESFVYTTTVIARTPLTTSVLDIVAPAQLGGSPFPLALGFSSTVQTVTQQITLTVPLTLSTQTLPLTSTVRTRLATSGTATLAWDALPLNNPLSTVGQLRRYVRPTPLLDRTDSYFVAAIASDNANRGGNGQVTADALPGGQAIGLSGGPNSMSDRPADVACNNSGDCRVVWDQQISRTYAITSSIRITVAATYDAALDPNVSKPPTFALSPITTTKLQSYYGPVIASDGADFLVASELAEGGKTYILLQHLNRLGSRLSAKTVEIESTRTITTPNINTPSSSLSMDLVWIGSRYRLAWKLNVPNSATTYPAIYVFDIDRDGNALTDAKNSHGVDAQKPTGGSPVLAYDPVTDRTLMLFASANTEVNYVLWSGSDINNRSSGVLRRNGVPASGNVFSSNAAGLGLAYNPMVGGWMVKSFAGSLGEVHFFKPDLSQFILPALDVFSFGAGPLACPAYGSLPVADLRFEEMPGATSFVDSSGRGNNATCSGNGCPIAGLPGAVDSAGIAIGGGVQGPASDYALAFTNNQSISFPSLANQISEVYSVAFWYRARTPGSTPAEMSLSGQNNTLNIRIVNNGITFSVANNINNETLTGPGGMNNGAWHFVVATRDLNSNSQNLYVDGVAAPSTRTFTSLYPSVPSLTLSANAAELDHLRVYKTSLSASTVKALYERTLQSYCLAVGLPSTNIFGYWGKLSATTPEIRGGKISASGGSSITIDADKPKSSVTSVSNFQYLLGNTVHTIGGTASDPTSSVTKVEVSINGGAWQLASGLNSWAFNLPIAEGPYTIQTRATDILGNVETPAAPITVYGDTQPPFVDFATSLFKSPIAPNRLGNQWVVSLVGNVFDQGVYAGGVKTDAVQLLLQGQEGAQGNGWQPAPINGGWRGDYLFAPGLLDPTGTYTVSLRAIDSAGNRTEVENAGTVRVDAFGPVAQLSAQDAARSVISNTITISGLVTDTGPAGVDLVQVAFVSVEQIAAISNTVNSTQADALLNRTWLPASVAQNGAAATTWSIAVPAGLESEYQIDLRAYDKVGNLLRSDKAWRGIIDTLAPRVTVSGTLSSPWLNPTLNKSFYNVSVSCNVLDRYVDEASFTCPANGIPPVRQFNTNPNLQALFPDRTILNGLVVSNTYATDAPNSQYVTRACDGYGHCSTATINPTASTPPGCYWIENRATTYVLDINGGKSDLGTAVIAYPKNDPVSPNQLWYVNSDGSLQSKLNGFLLDLLGFNTAAGAPLGIWSRNVPASNNQLWNRIDQGNGYFTIQSRLNNYLVDTASANAAAQVVMQPQGNPLPSSQQWRLVQAPVTNCGSGTLAAASDLSVAQASVDTVSNLPKALVVTPGEGNRVDAQGAVQVTVAAEAAQGLKEVTLSLDGEVVATFPFARTDKLQASLNSVDLAMADGPHTLAAQASDWAGNRQNTVATSHFVVTSQRPTLTIDSQSLNNGWPVDSGVVVLQGSVSNLENLAAVQVRVGDQPFTNAQFGVAANGVTASGKDGAGQWSVAYPALDPQGKTLAVTVRAIDKTGQVITVKQGVVGDYATGNPPETALVQTPPVNSDETSASFAFSGTVAGEPSAAFECQLDDGVFAPCSSPTIYAELSVGSHTFRVRALNGQGYVDLTPAAFTWTVKGRGRLVEIEEAPAANTTSRSARFEFKASGLGDVEKLECSLDGSGFTACTSPKRYSALGDGTHSFQVRVPGNPASKHSWRISNAAPVATSMVVTTPQNANLALNLQSSDDDSLSYIIVTQPTQGRLLGSAPNLVYDPNTDFFGTDSFSFKADDGDATSNLATVTINVTPTPGQGGLQRDGFVVFGSEGIILRENVKVMSGDIAASNASQGPWLGDGAEVSIGSGVSFADSKSKVLGDTLFVGQGTALANANYNELRGPGTVKGTKVTPQALPLLNRFVAMPGIGVGKQNVDVASAGSANVAPGNYLSLNVAKGGEVSFSGGVYSFKEWNVGDNTKLYFAAATEIRISGRAIVGEHSYVGPAPSSAVTAKQIVIYIAGVNANTAVLGGLGAKAATFGPYATLAANVVAPNGTLLIRERSKAVGSFVARWVSVGKFSELTLANRFSPSTVEGRVDGYINLTLDDATGINSTAALSPNANDELLSEEGTNEDNPEAVKKVFLPVISSGAVGQLDSGTVDSKTVDSQSVGSVPESSTPSEEEQTSKLFLPAVSR